MADRRMFAKTIIDSDAFLEMPLTTQSLYFHLCMRADDDGFVNNPRKIQRIIGATDGDAEMLVVRKFIILFDSGVIVVKHWRMHNYLRKDRYKETVYQEEMKQLYVGENGAYHLKAGNQLATNGIPNGNQLETQYRIGKDSKDNTISSFTNVQEEDSVNAPISAPVEEKKKPDRTPYKTILDMYYTLCPNMSNVRPVNKYTDEIKKNVKARYAEYELEDFETVFKKAEASDFLNNRADVTFQASFDWLMRPKNFSKALNGNFDNIVKKQKETIKGTDIQMSLVADGTREDSPEPEVVFE